MAIPTIHVGCKVFGRSRLQAVIECGGLDPVACVDIDVEGARESVRSLGGSTAEMLAGRVYPTITEALERHPAEVCVIYASTVAHAALVVESLGLGLHTLCVKPIAVTQDEMRSVVAAHEERPDLLLVQGQNKRWNPAAAKMREWLREPHGIGEMLGGECRFSMRLDLRTEGRFDALTEGLFFHAAASHQLDQLVAAKGLPDHVTARTHVVRDEEIGHIGVAGTAGGQALMEYANGAVFQLHGHAGRPLQRSLRGLERTLGVSRGEGRHPARPGAAAALPEGDVRGEPEPAGHTHGHGCRRGDAARRPRPRDRDGGGARVDAQLDAGDLGADGGVQRVGAQGGAGRCEGDARETAGTLRFTLDLSQPLTPPRRMTARHKLRLWARSAAMNARPLSSRHHVTDQSPPICGRQVEPASAKPWPNTASAQKVGQ